MTPQEYMENMTTKFTEEEILKTVNKYMKSYLISQLTR